MASAQITLTVQKDVEAVWWYYRLQSSTASVPDKPTENPPSGWTTTEPDYTEGSTNTLYFCELTVFTDGSFSYSDVSVDSSYEAAKVAYNKAQSAEDTAQDAMDGVVAQGETIDATAGAVTGLKSTVADQGTTLDDHTAQLEQQQAAIDSQGTAIGAQAESLSALSTTLDLTRQSLDIVHTTADNINNYFSFSDGLTIGKTGQDTISRYASDGLSIIHKNTVVASFTDGGTTTPALTVDATFRIGQFVAQFSQTDGLLIDWEGT